MPAAAVVRDGVQEVRILALDAAYVPSLQQAKSGVPTRIIVETRNTRGCTRSFVIPSTDVERVLPQVRRNRHRCRSADAGTAGVHVRNGDVQLHHRGRLMVTTTAVLQVAGMHCASCGMLVDTALEGLPGVRRAGTKVRKAKDGRGVR
jgi:S1-C subfamily serine protease